MIDDMHDDERTYKSVREMLHMYDNISQFYSNGYSKEIIDGIFDIVRSTKIDKQVTMVLQRIKQNDHLRASIEAETYFLDDSIANGIVKQHTIRMNERIYCVLNGIHDIPKCKVCAGPLKNFMVNKTNEIHYDCCSVKCKANDPDNIAKRVESYLSRTPEQKLKTKLQTQKTIEQRFGNKCFMKTQYFKDKQLQYIKENGGECNVSQIKSVRQKVDDTNNNKYGNRCNLANENQKQLRRQTYLKNYGVDHPMKSKEFLIRYDDMFEQTHDGIRHAAQLESVKRKVHDKSLAKRRYAIKHNQHVDPLFDVDATDQLESYGRQFWWKCLDCGHVFASHLLSLFSSNSDRITICPFCMDAHKSNHSYQEFELTKCLCQMFPDLRIINNDNKVNRHIIPPQELDIWIPEKRIAIEYNGAFWHSVEFIMDYLKCEDKLYHILDKTKLCEKNGIHLIHVYEDEFINHRNQLLSLLNILITGSYKFDTSNDVIMLPHDKYPSFMNIDGYRLDHIEDPCLNPKWSSKMKIYHIYDSGQLVFKRVKVNK